ncbi:unnamed protein product [Cochlearia groenlandica]
MLFPADAIARASKGVMQILNCVIRGERDWFLTILMSLKTGGLDVNNLRQSVARARSQGISVRAMVIINPGNPTGQCLSEANLREISRFCYNEKLVLLGDEHIPGGASLYQLQEVLDVFYCLKLVEATGISTVPGSGFRQKEGVFHLRTTILPAEEEMPEIMDSFKKFNDQFMSQYDKSFGYSRM